MSNFIPAVIIFLIQIYLLFFWLKSRRKKDGKEKKICFVGFLLGQIYILWEVVMVNQTGTPLQGSPEQKMLMLRFLLGGTVGGIFTIIGLFYLSFATYLEQK